MKRGLLLFSHGSLLCGSEQTLLRHCRDIAASTDYDLVLPGFLNYSEPAFEATIERFRAAGITQITIVPYFLVPGKFVRVDLPRRVRSAQETFSDIQLALASPIGFSVSLADALIALSDQLKSKISWLFRKVSVNPKSISKEKSNSSLSVFSRRHTVFTASIEDLPHTPQLEEV